VHAQSQQSDQQQHIQGNYRLIPEDWPCNQLQNAFQLPAPPNCLQFWLFDTAPAGHSGKIDSWKFVYFPSPKPKQA